MVRQCKWVLFNLKIKYSNQEAAEYQIKKIKKKRGVEYLRSYKCDGCGGWHITSKENPYGQKK